MHCRGNGWPLRTAKRNWRIIKIKRPICQRLHFDRHLSKLFIRWQSIKTRIFNSKTINTLRPEHRNWVWHWIWCEQTIRIKHNRTWINWRQSCHCRYHCKFPMHSTSNTSNTSNSSSSSSIKLYYIQHIRTDQERPLFRYGIHCPFLTPLFRCEYGFCFCHFFLSFLFGHCFHMDNLFDITYFPH